MFSTNFNSLSNALDLEMIERKSRDCTKVCTYANTFLDECLWGITPAELVVVGADTGLGKSDFVLNLAFQNALNGRNVYLFSLEGSKNESISRLRWKFLSEEYYKKPDNRDWNYKKYIMNGLDTSDLDKVVDERMKLASSLHVFNNHKIMSIDELVFELGRVENADLIILDHLHYLSLDEGRNEAGQISEIVRAVKEVTKIRNIPIVLVSHLRKKDRFRVFPDNEDFHGSSNIAKEADTCIMIFRDPSNDTENLSETFFRVTKSRAGSERRFIGALTYDLHKREYLKNYSLKKITSKGVSSIMINERPAWAKSMRSLCQE